MKKDMIYGYYGYGNFGDDLFSYILSEELKRHSWSRANAVIPRNSFSRYDRWKTISSSLLNARSITLGGGSVLRRPHPLSIRSMQFTAKSIFNIPLTAVGVAVDSLNANIVYGIENFNFIGLRSLKEYEDNKSSNVHYTPDIALALMDYIDFGSSNRNIVSLCLTSVGAFCKSKNPQDVCNSIIDFYNNYNADSICIINMQPKNLIDTYYINLFREILGRSSIEVNVFNHEDPVETCRIIDRSSFIFTDRLHGAIVAYSLGIPFMLSNHHKKCAEFIYDCALSEDFIFNIDDSEDDIARKALSSCNEIGLLRAGRDMRIKSRDGIRNWANSLGEMISE